jgi:hypothetical protein
VKTVITDTQHLAVDVALIRLRLAVDAALDRPRTRRQVEALIDASAREFARDLPGYEAEYEGDNYLEAGYDWIASKLTAAGHDPDEFDDTIWETIESTREASSTAMTVAANGGGGREELEIAESYWTWRDAPGTGSTVLRPPASVNRSRPPVRLLQHGARHRRAAHGGKTIRRGPRRGADSRAGPDDEGELPGDIAAAPLPIGGRR